MSADRIGFIGLGDIGAPMAMRILDAGHPLTVFNRTPDKAQPFAEKGAAVARSLGELAAVCDVILFCVSNGEAVEHVVFGPGGLAEAGRAGQVVVDLSTIHPVHTQQMAARLAAERGMAWVDAPVSGGPAGARLGTLAVMAGGDAAVVERVRPVLSAFGGRITHMGPVGCGMATKACNQMLNYGTGAVVAETLNFAARFGIDPALIPEAVAGGFADSNVLRNYGQQMVAGTYKGNTLTAMKDIDIIMDMGRITCSAMPVTSLVASFFRMQIAQGYTSGGLPTPMRMYAQGPLKAVGVKKN
ncbi:MAG: NAD(P)-dependent oxidoreductase [Hydrogenophaga sp.]|uniref:NAD(P)-dependent oxidoreductase n=1 Tax=Hydrogenophaga sp. TaxID=1904254 RepID=UPI003D101117